MKQIKKVVSVILSVIMVIGIFLFAFEKNLQTVVNAADAFTLYGTAKYLDDGSIQLTPVSTWCSGSCYYNDIIDAKEGFAMSVNFLAGGGTGADGIAFCFSETKGTGTNGQNLGFISGNNTYGVELDSYYNYDSNDPCQRHIAILGKNISNHLAWAKDSRVDDNLWHSLKVIYNANSHTMSVFLDGLQTLTSNDINLPDYCYLGVTAATGGSTNRHLISDFSIISKYVNISSNDCGVANFTVVNAQTLNPIKGANIFISNETDGDTTFVTDVNGNVSALLPIGKQTVSVYCGNYRARNINIDVAPGINNIPTIGLSEYGIVDANITVNEMSYDEIVSAGIDPTAPENHQIFKYEVTFTYDPQIDVSSIAFYFNSEGKCIGGEGESSSAGFGEFPAYKAGEGYAIKLPDDTVVYAASEKMLLVIRGEARWLKEMFDVEMIIMNRSLTDTVENCTATLDLPEGMSLAKMSEGNQSLSQTIDHIDKGKYASVHWYLCGEKEGDYTIGASLEGTTKPFDEPFSSYYEAGSAIHVYAGSAFSLTFEVPDVTYHNEDAAIKIILENVSDRTIYNVTHSIKNLKQCRVTYESDGTVDEETYKDVANVGHITVSEMKPGDKIVIELSVNIMFDSKSLKEMLESWCGTIDKVEKYCNLFDVAQKLTDTVYGLYSKIITSVASVYAANEKLKKVETLDEAKSIALQEFSSTLTKFLSAFSSNNYNTLELISKFGNSKVYSDFVKITDNINENIFVSMSNWVAAKHATDFLNMAGYLETILKDAATEGSSGRGNSFDIFDSIRTAIRAIPIYYFLSREESYATTLSGSTTEIPIRITTYNNGKIQYFGVSDMSKYIYNLGIAAIGKVKIPGIYGILGGFDANDTSGYNAAVKYIKATENEIARVQAISATGDVSFKAYIVKKDEPSPVKAKAILKTAASDEIDSLFTLSCDNDTAKYENGVLTFSGGGIIEIMPNSITDGILYIEDSNGNIFTYNIEVVPPHECDTNDSVPIIVPTNTTNGYIAKCCSICGDVLDIEEIIACDTHSFDSWIVEQEVSCSEIGMESCVCTICGYTEIKTIDMLEHTYSNWIVEHEPSCTVEGTQYRVCSACNTVDTKTIPSLDHSYGAWKTVTASTCKVKGTEERVCTVCNTAKETRELPLAQHTKVTDTAVAATCTKTGLTEGTHCSVCKTVLTKQNTVPMLDHKDGNNDGKCDTCGKNLGTKPTEPSNPSAKCSHMCHKGGFMGFIWKIANLFNKLFKTKQYCSCGAKHW